MRIAYYGTLAFLLGVAGCAPEIEKTADLNKGLTYLPWDASNGPQYSGGPGTTDKDIYRLQPLAGMRIVLTSEYSAQAGANLRPPIIMQMAWTVPSLTAADGSLSGDVDHSAQTRLFFSWLLQSSLPFDQHDNTDPLADARAMSARDNFMAGYYDFILRSLVVEYAPNAQTRTALAALGAQNYSSDFLKTLVCRAKLDASQPPNGWVAPKGGSGKPEQWKDTVAQALLFEVPVEPANGGPLPSQPPATKLFRTQNWTDFWALEDLGELNGVGNPHDGDSALQYPAVGPGSTDLLSIREGRGLVDVEIPVRFETEAASRYVPICTTLGDIERKSGVRVAAIRRYKGWLPKGMSENEDNIATVAADQYSYLGLDRRAGTLDLPRGSWIVNASALADQKNDILLAPGDVLIVEQSDRRATDIPPDDLKMPRRDQKAGSSGKLQVP